MLAEYQKKSNYGIAIGILLQIASIPLGDTIISLLVLLAGAGFSSTDVAATRLAKGIQEVLACLEFSVCWD